MSAPKKRCAREATVPWIPYDAFNAVGLSVTTYYCCSRRGLSGSKRRIARLATLWLLSANSVCAHDRSTTLSQQRYLTGATPVGEAPASAGRSGAPRLSVYVNDTIIILLVQCCRGSYVVRTRKYIILRCARLFPSEACK